MAAYTFELMTQEQAAQFTSTDILTFGSGPTTSGGSTATMVSARQSSASGTDTLSGIILTYGGKSLTFPADQISAASLAQRVQFSDNSRLLLGDGDGTTINGTAANSDVIFGFQGNDTITSGATATGGDPRNDRPDYLNGGIGADTITGGGSNDHIWGNSISNDQPNGRQDGADSLSGGLGGDYIQGNQGNDTINGGGDNDRLFGGQANDLIYGGSATEAVNDAGAFGSDTINGNIGQDTIFGGFGNDFLRGGRDNDSINGGGQDDTISGDAGDDTIIGGTGQDIMWGDNMDGANTARGGDTFRFGVTSTQSQAAGTGGAPGAVTTTLVSDALFRENGQDDDQTDMIMDFQLGTDVLRIDLTGTGTGATAGGPLTTLTTGQEEGITFQTLYSAYVYAQGLLANDPNADIAAVQLNGDTMLFYASNDAVGPAGEVDSAIRLVGIDVDDITAQNLGLTGTAGGSTGGTGGGTTATPGSGF